MSARRILFVCTGNICRSPTAEGVLRAKATDAGLDKPIEVDSAGLQGWHAGEPPDGRAIAQAATKGIDIAGQRARTLHDGDFDSFDLIIGMDKGHYRTLRRLAPQHSLQRIRLLLDYVEGMEGSDVPDPYYGGAYDYALAFDLIERGVDALLESLADPAA